MEQALFRVLKELEAVPVGEAEREVDLSLFNDLHIGG
jgi:transcriptional regulator of acetoin/glycerol metabolism